MASLVVGGLVCTSSFAFAADDNGNNKTVTADNYEGGDSFAGYSDDGDKSNNKLTVSDVDEIAFKIGSTTNAITLKNFTAEKFNINDSTYVTNNGKAVKK